MKNADKWYKAMQQDVESLYKNGNWELGEKPTKKKKAMGYKWVYRIK